MQSIEQQVASPSEVEELKAAIDEHAIVAITDSTGRITYVNEKFCAISGYSREELIGRDHRVVNSGLHPKAFFADLWGTIAHGRTWHGNIRNRAKNGSYYWVATTIMPFLNEAGKPRQYVSIRVDITKLKQAEEETLRLNAEMEKRIIERSEQLAATNRELEAFSYSVSHDLRAPLRAVDGYSQILLDDYGSSLPAEGRRYLETIRRSTHHMASLIDDLLSFSQLGRSQVAKHSIDMALLVRSALESPGVGNPPPNTALRIGELPECTGDSAMLRQVWVNLISNAYKFSRNKAAPNIEIASSREKGRTVYHIRDNGVGFDMRYAGKLFGVFQRLHRAEDYEGTGVGLAIVQRVIDRHGGRVWAESSPGQGATFFFTLEEAPQS